MREWGGSESIGEIYIERGGEREEGIGIERDRDKE